MTEQEFAIQIKRLKEQFGEKSFSNEKCKLIYSQFKIMEEEKFYRIVNELICNSRYTPLLKDFINAWQFLDTKDRELRNQYKIGTPADILNLPSGKADFEFVNSCKKTLSDFLDKKISKNTFLEHCQELELIASGIMKAKVKQ